MADSFGKNSKFMCSGERGWVVVLETRRAETLSFTKMRVIGIPISFFR